MLIAALGSWEIACLYCAGEVRSVQNMENLDRRFVGDSRGLRDAKVMRLVYSVSGAGLRDRQCDARAVR